MKSVNCSKPGYKSITCSKIEHIPYNLIFTTKCNDSLILSTIISWKYLNYCWQMNMLVTSQYQPRLSSITNLLQADQPIRSQYSHQIKLYIIITYVKYKTCHHKQIILFVYKFHRRHNFEIFERN
jgi:mRNA-degrading endonuclease YafQ of YafQ-DinJ toxin-antitoxin module